MKVLILAVLTLPSCLGQGTPWTADETEIIYSKLYQLFKNPSGVIWHYQRRYPEREYQKKARPNAPKALRLAFHDCIPYEDGSGGCDGCLNPEGMNIDMLKKYDTDIDMFKGPDITLTNNNGLFFIADILEEIYTNKDFPPQAGKLEVSMKDSGKSRADFWAFAGLVAAHFGIETNNLACEGQADMRTRTCGHLDETYHNCTLHYNKLPTFKTGRVDCQPDPSLDRPYFTVKHEAHPHAHANGPDTVDYYKKHFNGMSAREAIALTEGAHSFGFMNVEVGYFKYQWTRSQQQLLNNQQFRHISSKPQWFMDCANDPVDMTQGFKKEKFRLVGDAYGVPAQTTWICYRLAFSEGGGPYQWFHRYDRCPASNDCAAIDLPESRAEMVTPEGCCDDLEDGMKCQPWCQRSQQNDETSLPADIGFYLKFRYNNVTGKPYGCPGFDDDPKWVDGSRRITFPECPVEDYAPEGEPLWTIVEDYADHAQKWVDDFWPAMEKMSSNGYSDSDLIEAPMDAIKDALTL